MTKEPKTTELKKVQSIEENLIKQIEKLQNLNKLVKNRSVFQTKKDQLVLALAELEKDILSDNFETDKHSFSISVKENYRDNSVITISNPVIIKEVIDFVIKKIDSKVDEIEQTLINEA